MAGAYSFPVLKVGEIASALSQLGINVAEAELSKPTHETLRPALESLVELLVGVSKCALPLPLPPLSFRVPFFGAELARNDAYEANLLSSPSDKPEWLPCWMWFLRDRCVGAASVLQREEMQTPDLAAVDELEFPELHEESVGTVAFLRALGKLMRASGVPDFCMRDVFKPEAQRLQRMLSAVINFAKFREEKVANYDELIDASDSLTSRREHLTSEFSRLVRLSISLSPCLSHISHSSCPMLCCSNRRLSASNSGRRTTASKRSASSMKPSLLSSRFVLPLSVE